MFSSKQLAFGLHVFIEIPAALLFLINPSATLPVAQPYAHPVIRQYALLLICSSLIAAFFTVHNDNTISCHVAGALALYHLGPLVRAVSRVLRKESGKTVMGNPWMHLAAHGICATALAREVTVQNVFAPQT